MATAPVNDSPAVVATTNAEDVDPFNNTPRSRSSGHRYSAFDTNLFSSYSEASPSQAKMALEAHIADTDRRIREASRLGTSLLEQKKELSSRLKDVEKRQGSNEIGPDLRQKLTDLEKEYNDLGRESARAFIPKSRKSGVFSDDPTAQGSLSPDRSTSPSKLSVPANTSSRKQRNSSNRVEDLAFATEISTSLLSQLRHLQNVLAEKEEALRDANTRNAKLIADAESANFRLRTLDENEQRYKDENWQLETQVQDLTTQIKEAGLREQKLTNSLNASKEEKSTVERECDDIRASHNKLTEEHASLRKKHDSEVAGLRRNVSTAQNDKDSLQKKIAELTSQNEDLAKAVAYRINADRSSSDLDPFLADKEIDLDNLSPDHSPPPSPTKGTPRHGGLESETLKSSLHHAHRMIQNLKNNIHREKTEKVELRRMLQDARDEIEVRRADGGATAANAGKRRKPTSQNDLFKKPSRPDKLGGPKGTTEEIVEDPTWEEYDESPSRSRGMDKRASAAFSTTSQSEGFETANEREANATENEGFETANENETNANETDSFETAGSVQADDTDGDLTETEATQSPDKRQSTLRERPAGVRGSYQSTASDDGDLTELRTTPFSQPPRYKLKLNRGGLRGLSETPSAKGSPASFMSDRSLPTASQNLASELEDFGEDTSVANSTPSRSLASQTSSPDAQYKRGTIIHSSPMTAIAKPEMVDSGTMTDIPEPIDEASIAPVATDQSTPSGVVAADISPVAQQTEANESVEDGSEEHSEIAREPVPSVNPAAESVQLQMSPIKMQHTLPVAPEIAQLEPREATSSSTDIAAIAPVAMVLSDQETRDQSAKESNGTLVSSGKPEANVLSHDGEMVPQKQGEDQSFVEGDRALPLSPSENLDENLPIPAAQVIQPAEQTKRVPFQPVSGNAAMPKANPSTPMKNEGTQTTVSSDQIDNLIQEKNRRAYSASSPSLQRPSSAGRAMPTGARSSEQLGLLEFPSPSPKSPKRPGSAGSARKGVTTSSPQVNAPPLPPDHREVIAAAARTSSMTSNMPPPVLPASALRTSSQQFRPHTPSGSIVQQGSSRFSSTNARNKPPSVAGRSDVTRRSSMSSFASEVEERFELGHAGNVYPEQGFDMGTDPRMIQAITQTMIGEFMYKYTRKAGRGDISENRHRRFFWIHPYTRTLYWSTHDPSRANRSELKAKSVPIEAVRVITDTNPNPPGLHPKSIVIVTPGRSIKLTAPTSHRHETWFNALSYLLLRSSPSERRTTANQQARQYNSTNYTNTATSIHERSNTMSSITSEDLSEFNPGSGNRAASHRTTGSQNYSYRSYAASSSGARATGSVNRASTSSLASRQVSTLVPTLTARPNQNSTTPVASIQEHSQRSSVDQNPSSMQGTPTPVRATADAQGFQKPVRPMSMNTSSQTQSPAKSGRLSSLSGRLSRQSFFGRNRSSTQFAANSQEPTPESTPSKGSAQISKSLLPSDITQAPVEAHEHENDAVEGAGTRTTGTMENVRACCDGKHDVGSLSHTHQRGTSRSRSHASLSSRVSGAFG